MPRSPKPHLFWKEGWGLLFYPAQDSTKGTKRIMTVSFFESMGFGIGHLVDHSKTLKRQSWITIKDKEVQTWRISWKSTTRNYMKLPRF